MLRFYLAFFLFYWETYIERFGIELCFFLTRLVVLMKRGVLYNAKLVIFSLYCHFLFELSFYIARLVVDGVK